MSVSPAIVSNAQGTPGSSHSVLPTNAQRVGPGRGEAGACARVSGTGSPPRVQPAGHTGSHEGSGALRHGSPLPSPAPCPLAVSKMQSHLLVCGKDMRGERVRTGASRCHFPRRLGHSASDWASSPSRLSLQSSLQDHSVSVDTSLCPTPVLQC